MSEKLQINRNHLATKMARIGLPSLVGLQSNRRWSALIRFSEGASTTESCAAEGIAISALEDLLRICVLPIATAVRLVRQRTDLKASLSGSGASTTKPRYSSCSATEEDQLNAAHLKRPVLTCDETQAA
jgi:hypothetical protein